VKYVCDSYSSPNISRVFKSRRMRWPGYVARIGDRVAGRGFVERSEEMRPLGRTRRRWEDTIKMDFSRRLIWRNGQQ
jgi:hypothetical protein